jgi:pimeloyl-ACP methyl ester carboxylesterase
MAAALSVQRRHLRTLAHDADFATLRGMPGGRPLNVTSADGTKLYAESFGSEDGPAIVLAHGWTEQLTLWGPVIEHLVRHNLRAVAFDLRGHGRSQPAADGDYDLDRFGEDVEAVLTAATPEGKRAIVAGHSLGAMSIAAWAEHHDVAARARGAALINTGLGDLMASHLLLGEVAARFNNPALSKLFLSSPAPLLGFSTPIQHALVRYAAFGPEATGGQVAFYERMLMDCAPSVRAACGLAISDMNLHHAVERLTVPTLVVAGDGDRLTPPSHAERIAEALPDPAGLLILPRTGHMSPLERPAELAEAIVELAASSAPRAEVEQSA